MANCMRCSSSSFPFINLGVAVGQNMAKVDSCGPIIDSFRNRLVVWKAKYLSFGWRMTLIKSVLSSIGSYLMSIYHVTVTVINHLERLRSSFFWGIDLDDRRMH